MAALLFNMRCKAHRIMWHRRRPGHYPTSSCISLLGARLESTAGQATVEGAFLIPVIFLLLLLLLQPGILLYDRIIMHGAAAEACRMLATTPSDSSAAANACEQAVRRHLGAIPQQENFHCHQGGCSWEIELSGNEGSQEVQARIAGRVKLLPLLDMGGTLLGISDGSGVVSISVEVSEATQDAWVAGSEYGLDPDDWVGKWE